LEIQVISRFDTISERRAIGSTEPAVVRGFVARVLMAVPKRGAHAS
jgi:hypothetical protein